MNLKRTWVLSAAVATVFLGGATGDGGRSSAEAAWASSVNELQTNMTGIRRQITNSLEELIDAKDALKRLDRAKRAGDRWADEEKARLDNEIEKLKRELASSKDRAKKAEDTVGKRDVEISNLKKEAKQAARTHRKELEDAERLHCNC